VLFDRWSSQRKPPARSTWRLVLVFGCALIHGLGLAGALSLEGLDARSRLLSLMGFNLGIETAQLAVAVGAGLLVAAIQRLHGPRTTDLTLKVASIVGMLAGSVWLIQRSGWS
jgi:hypothetical protein